MAHLQDEVAFISIKIDYSMQRTMQKSCVGGDRAKIWMQMSSMEKSETEKFRHFHGTIMAINT